MTSHVTQITGSDWLITIEGKGVIFACTQYWLNFIDSALSYNCVKIYAGEKERVPVSICEKKSERDLQ